MIHLFLKGVLKRHRTNLSYSAYSHLQLFQTPVFCRRFAHMADTMRAVGEKPRSYYYMIAKSATETFQPPPISQTCSLDLAKISGSFEEPSLTCPPLSTQILREGQAPLALSSLPQFLNPSLKPAMPLSRSEPLVLTAWTCSSEWVIIPCRRMRPAPSASSSRVSSRA